MWRMVYLRPSAPKVNREAFQCGLAGEGAKTGVVWFIQDTLKARGFLPLRLAWWQSWVSINYIQGAFWGWEAKDECIFLLNPRGEERLLTRKSPITLGERVEMQRGETKNKSVQMNPSSVGIQALRWFERNRDVLNQTRFFSFDITLNFSKLGKRDYPFVIIFVDWKINENLHKIFFSFFFFFFCTKFNVEVERKIQQTRCSGVSDWRIKLYLVFTILKYWIQFSQNCVYTVHRKRKEKRKIFDLHTQPNLFFFPLTLFSC